MFKTIVGAVTMFTVNTATDGIGAIFKLHEEIALKVLDEATEPVGTRFVCEEANERLDAMCEPGKSRATYINFLKALAAAELIEVTDATGKGGHYSLYSMKPGGFRFFKHVVARRIIQSIVNAFEGVDFALVINELDLTSRNVKPDHLSGA